MIQSMTAFARASAHEDWGSATWEIRSVNHRYLEISPRLPDALRELETAVRDHVRKYAARGKFDINLRFNASGSVGNALQINLDMAKKIVAGATEVTSLLSQASHINPLQLMQWPGVVETAALDLEILTSPLLKLLDSALEQNVATRTKEGEALKQTFIKRLATMREIVAQLETHMPDILSAQRERLLKRFAEAKLQFDAERLEQELLLIAQKTDVAEEIDRLRTHIEEVTSVLEKDEPIGRRLDFLMQELNREANTTASKSINSDTTRCAVDLKVLIEQMREQVQNIQ